MEEKLKNWGDVIYGWPFFTLQSATFFPCTFLFFKGHSKNAKCMIDLKKYRYLYLTYKVFWVLGCFMVFWGYFEGIFGVFFCILIVFLSVFGCFWVFLGYFGWFGKQIKLTMHSLDSQAAFWSSWGSEGTKCQDKLWG